MFLHYHVMPKSIRRIAVLVDTSSGWGRRIIRGIANYGVKHGPWQLVVDERGMQESMHLKSGWEGDGIIARVSDKRLYDELMAAGKPAVNVSGIILEGVDLPRVTTHYDAVAQIALQHFRERGFNNLAYCGIEHLPHVQRHCQAFVDCANDHDLTCDVFHPKLKGRNRTWETEREELLRWLRELPKPSGIFTWGTQRGRDVLNVCTEAGIAVPDQVAVLAGADDDLLCEVCHPAMSSIVNPSEQVGYEAARILDTMLQGDAPPCEPVLLEPLEVNTRLSTDTLAIDDPIVSSAIRFIRENAHRAIQVDDVVDTVSVSRRALERRFEVTVGHSPAHEIQQTHLKRARRLLRETDMSIADVAAASGYCSAEYMSGIFRKTTGRTPLKYRTWVRAM